jgi:chemotaxis regulatin CheY-phosphate phosphatase CheZ
MGNKPEVFLEVGAGFLRIPTSEINYNITVIDSGGSSTIPVPSAPVVVAPSPVPAAVAAGDDFYEVISNDLYRDIGALAKSLSSTITDIPAEDRKQERATLDEAGDKIEGAKAQLRDIVEMTEKAAMDIMDSVENVQGQSDTVKTLLAELKEHKAFNAEGAGEEVESESEQSPLDDEVSRLSGNLDEVQTMLKGLGGDAEPKAEAVPETKKIDRYLFDLDVIFQTLYELCTNETVKDHITDVRGKAGELFDVEAFQDKISVKAAKYEADSDNYFDVPMSDVFQSLFGVCSDKGTKNLLKKMDSGQGSIFLDQAIPVEAPEVAEVEVEVAGEPKAPSSSPVAIDIEPIAALLVEVQDGLSRVPDMAPAGGGAPATSSAMSESDKLEVFAKIEAAFDVSATITTDVSKITEILSFQDLSGQQILKIIKLLGDFQVQLLAIVVNFGSQLKYKTENADLSIEESKQFAQEDVDKYIAEVPQDPEVGTLDQDMVNSMLADFGFD